MSQPQASAATRPGPPHLIIAPATRVAEPIDFEVLPGDALGPRADRMRHAVADVRLEVFVAEQQVPFIQEVDARDDAPTTIHVLARGADSTPLGAGRLLLDPHHRGQVHLGRLAVRRVARGTGLGARLVAVLEASALEYAAAPLKAQDAARAGVAPGTPGVTVILSAQEQAMGFYERCGHQVLTGVSYLDAGIAHQDMVRTLTR